MLNERRDLSVKKKYGSRAQEGKHGEELLCTQGAVGVMAQHIGEQRRQRLEEALVEWQGQAVARIVGVGTLLFERLGNVGWGAEQGGEFVVGHVC